MPESHEQRLADLAAKYFPESPERYARALALANEAWRDGYNDAEVRALAYRARHPQEEP
jgi:hypothetical protein